MAKKNKLMRHTRSRFFKKTKEDTSPQENYYRQDIVQQAMADHLGGRLSQAEALYRQILSTQPEHPVALHYLGILAHQKGRNEIAAKLISKALKYNPNDVFAHINLGNVLKEQGKLDEAVACFQKAISLKPDEAAAHNNLGNTLKDQGKLDEAQAHFQRALNIKPHFAEANRNLGLIFREFGKLDDAVACFKKALFYKPGYARAYRNLSSIVQYSEVDDDIHKMEELYNKKGEISDADRIDLGFALGKVFGDLKDYDKSFDFIFEANRLKRKLYQYSTQEDQDFFARIRKTFSPSFFASHSDSGFQDRTSIFIIGMPRSGTTLVEQILSSHPLVFGAGELNILGNLTNSLCPESVQRQYPECVQDVDMDKFEEIGAEYIEKMREYSKDAKYITDKMPHNFMHVGLIRTILPKAKVIHCTRDPMANCFSIFKTEFEGEHKYAYDMNELGRYYNLYRDLMAHWEKVLPGYLYNIRYEELVSDQKNQTENLLDFCGLPWNDSCLAFYKTERRIPTASLVQVRQPMYQNSIELWTRYEKQLEPLRKVILDS